MILVTGATGNIGRELARELDARGAEFRVLFRDPARAAGLPGRAERFTGDLTDPATLAPAFVGASAVFLLVPGLATEPAAHAMAAARAAGVGRIVLLSAYTVLGDPMPAMGRWHHEREEMVRAAGVPATILRPGGFMTNCLEWRTTIDAGGYVPDPTGPGRWAPIDPADIAAAAAVVLTEDGHAGRAYALTGDEALTLAEQVAILGRALGRDLEVRPAATPEEAIAARYPRGAPRPLADAILEGFARMRADTTGFRTTAVRDLLGRPPATFAAWCTRHAGLFRPVASP
jgi:uncharacterized protein YbjT (DUF2867 family)